MRFLLSTRLHPWLALAVLLGISACTAPVSDWERLDDSVIRLMVVTDKAKGEGTAFAINDQGIYVTNHHVIADALKGGKLVAVEQIVPQEKFHPAEVIWHSREKDLALVEVPDWKRPPLPLGDAARVKKNQQVVAIGFPGASDFGPDTPGFIEPKLKGGIYSAPNRFPLVEGGEPVPLLLTTLVEQKASHHPYALARFDADFVLLADFTADAKPLLAAVKALKIQGKRTELFRLSLMGLQQLENCPFPRRVLVLLSDGDAEDLAAAYSPDRVIQQAQQAAVDLITLGFGDTLQQQNLRRLAESGGWYALVQPGKGAALVQPFYRWLESRGQLGVPLSQIPANTQRLQLQITLADGTTLTKALESPSSDPLEAFSANPLEAFSANPSAVLSAWQPWLAQRFPEVPPEYWPWLPWFLVSALTGLLVVLIRRRRRKATPQESDALPVPEINQQAAERPLLAIITDGISTFEMRRHQIRIGALEDNDLVIDHPTVSRYHAVLTFRDGDFYLTDNGSTNHSFVNGEIVTHCPLNDGDKLQFGDWQGDFRIHRAPNTIDDLFGKAG